MSARAGSAGGGGDHGGAQPPTGPLIRRPGTALNRDAVAPPTLEEKLIKGFIVVSVAVHAVVIFSSGWKLARDKIVMEEEFEIAADLVPDLESTAPPITAIPDALKKAEEAKVPDNLLPQLPKNFTVEQPKQKEEEIAEEKIEEKKPVVEAKPAPEEKKAEPAITKEDDQKNKLQMTDALKRLAMEQLRQQQKTAKELEAPEKDPLAQIADALAKKGTLNKGAGTSINGARAKKYLAMLREAIRTNYSLPEVYNLKGATIRAVINLSINDAGEIIQLDVDQSSGDPVFDSLTLEAVKASVPLPKPPPDLVGEAIVINLTP